MPNQTDSMFYKILVSPSFRWLRHLLLIVGVAAISISQRAYSFGENADKIGGYIYYVSFATFLLILSGAYLHIYLLVPRLLMRGRYVAYFSISSIATLVVVFFQTLEEYGMNSYLGLEHVRTDYFNTVSILNMASDFALFFICITGVSLAVVLKNWVEENHRIGELERKLLQSEVAFYKEQINPALLLGSLHRTGELASTDPDRAADMVMQLSQMLRYQLYEGNREGVLLGAEISFLENYLALEKSYRPEFDYSISSQGDVSRFFVPPLIFIPFIQQALSDSAGQTGPRCVNVSFVNHDGRLMFECAYGVASGRHEDDFVRVLSRLDRLYGDEFDFSDRYNDLTGQRTLHLKFPGR